MANEWTMAALSSLRSMSLMKPRSILIRSNGNWCNWLIEL